MAVSELEKYAEQRMRATNVMINDVVDMVSKIYPRDFLMKTKNEFEQF